MESVESVVEDKKKKMFWRRVLLILVMMTAVLFLGLFIWGMSRSGWSIQQLKKIIFEKHYSCFMEHKFEDANCLHGTLCKECGYEYGEKTGHSWVEATCTSVKYCNVCQKKEGKALGHMVGLGFCERCGGTSQDLMNEYYHINEYISKAFNEFSEAVVYIEKTAEYRFFEDTYAYSMRTDLISANEYLTYAIEECSDYPEFSAVKVQLKKALDVLNITSDSVVELAQGAIDAMKYIEKAVELLIKLDCGGSMECASSSLW